MGRPRQPFYYGELIVRGEGTRPAQLPHLDGLLCWALATTGCGACFLDETPLPSLPFGPFLPFDEKMGARAHSGLRCLELACLVLAWCWC